MTSTAFEKRIRRRLGAQQHTFFVATAPGLEHICLQELKTLDLATGNVSVVNGGVEFDGFLHDGYAANLHLRTANRILMRIASFRASNFRQLSRNIRQIPWEFFLHKAQLPEIRVSTAHSRLYHTKAIAERIETDLLTYLDTLPELKTPLTPASLQRLFIRAEDDVFVISIDSSGELLFKRGLKAYVGKAPLRETLAAAILSLAGYDPAQPLADPMCGSGTFSLEAAMMALNIPAGWYRRFAFQDWPCFRAGRWKHLRREAEKSFKKATHPVIFASDNDPCVYRNFSDAIKENNLSKIIRTANLDFFSMNFQSFANEFNLNGKPPDRKANAKIPSGLPGGPDLPRGLVVINPPYGLRLGTTEQSHTLLREIAARLRHAFKGWNVALIVPNPQWIKQIPFKVKRHALFHGGLDLTLLTGKIK